LVVAGITNQFGDVHTSTGNGMIRFVWNWTTLYACNSAWAGYVATAIWWVTATNWNRYSIVVNPWTDIKFYVNGTLVATHTTNLPTNAAVTYIALWTNIAGSGIELRPIIVSIEN
jgi:hypothetical protein